MYTLFVFGRRFPPTRRSQAELPQPRLCFCTTLANTPLPVLSATFSSLHPSLRCHITHYLDTFFSGEAISLKEVQLKSALRRFPNSHALDLSTQLLGHAWRLAVGAMTTVVIIIVTLLQTQLPAAGFYVIDIDITVHLIIVHN